MPTNSDLSAILAPNYLINLIINTILRLLMPTKSDLSAILAPNYPINLMIYNRSSIIIVQYFQL